MLLLIIVWPSSWQNSHICNQALTLRRFPFMKTMGNPGPLVQWPHFHRPKPQIPLLCCKLANKEWSSGFQITHPHTAIKAEPRSRPSLSLCLSLRPPLLSLVTSHVALGHTMYMLGPVSGKSCSRKSSDGFCWNASYDIRHITTENRRGGPIHSTGPSWGECVWGSA